MGAKQDELRTIADSRFGSGSPETWHVGLSTTTSNPDGSGFTEPSGANYSRVAVTNNGTNFPSATTVSGRTTKKNGAKITFPNPSGNWGSVVEWGIFSASSGGTPKYTSPLSAPISPKNGNTPVEFDIAMLELAWGGS